VSPRRHHRRGGGTPLDEGSARRGVQVVQVHPDGEWQVRSIPGGVGEKAYRCPGCDQEIRPGAAHVVAWPAQGWGGAGDRRHWHTPCWRSRDRLPGAGR
jgi:hypothetical protein